MRIEYVNLNTDPHLPPDGGLTSIPHLYVAYLDDQPDPAPVGVLVVSVGNVIDMVYVDPAHRRHGVATALLAAARARHGTSLGTDDRLTEAGVAFARRHRLPLYGATRRQAVLDTAEHEDRGAATLRRAAVAVLREHAPPSA